MARAGFPDMTTYLKVCKHSKNENDLSTSLLIQVGYASVQFYIPAAVSVKLSLLCLYGRIFPTPSFRLASVVVMILVSIWGITFFFVNLFLCNPPRKFWDPTVPGFCLEYGKIGLLVGLSLEIGLDCTILVLPIKMISGLQMNTGKKVSVALIFLVGALYVLHPHRLSAGADPWPTSAVITNIVRCIMSYEPETGGRTYLRPSKPQTRGPF